MRLDLTLLSELRRQAQAEYPFECCGFVVQTPEGAILARKTTNTLPRTLPADQIALKAKETAANAFLIDPLELHLASLQGKILAIYHSHPDESSALSESDYQVSEEYQLPIIAVSFPAEGYSTYSPLSKGTLIGRPFIYGLYDCYTLVRDWYARNGVLLPEARYKEFGWWRNSANDSYYRAGLEQMGFCLCNDLSVGTVVAMRHSSEHVNHIGVISRPGMLLHHLSRQCSMEVPYGGTWEHSTAFTLRHNSIVS